MFVLVDLENHNIKQNKVTIEVVKYGRCSVVAIVDIFYDLWSVFIAF